MNDELNTSSQPEPTQPKVGPAAVKKQQAILNSVQAEVVQIDQSTANQVQAETVSMRQSSATHVSGKTIDASNCGIGIVQAENLTLIKGGLGIASAKEATVSGQVTVLIGQSVQLNESHPVMVLTREVHSQKIRSILFISGKTDAQVETILDQRSVALFGLAFGVALGLILAALRLISHR